MTVTDQRKLRPSAEYLVSNETTAESSRSREARLWRKPLENRKEKRKSEGKESR